MLPFTFESSKAAGNHFSPWQVSVAAGLWLLFLPVWLIGEDRKPQEKKENPAAEESLLLADLPVVEAAALRVQTLKEAPANVTVVTAAEIQRYGYRTLAEVLDSVRGFYITSDHGYRYAGTRGFALPADYNTRFLVMINGHAMTENIYNSNGFFGQDFGLDMDLVERIEIIRGPTSSLYGSNGVLANINVITKSPVDQPRGMVTMETGSFGEKKAGFITSQYLGKGVNLLLSGSVFHSSGQSLFLPGHGDREGINAVADHLDGENGYHSYAQLHWGNWTGTAYFNSRRTLLTQGLFGGRFNDSGNAMVDQRNFASLDYSRQVGVDRRFRWRTSFDQYRFRDVYILDPAEPGGMADVRDANEGDWLTSQVSFTAPVQHLGSMTIGAEGYHELRNLQTTYTTTPVTEELLRISRPNIGAALFVQQEVALTGKLKLYAGLRQDYSKNFRWFTSPRVAAVYSRSAAVTYKASYARAFRNPSTVEKYYETALYQVRNLELTQEKSHVFEGSVERSVGKRASAVLSGFHYLMGDVIHSDLLDDGRIMYRNDSQIRLSGVEGELAGSLWGLEASASAVVQRGREVSPSVRLVNSPSMLGKARIGLPIVWRRATIGMALRSWTSRTTGAMTNLPAVVLLDAGFTTAKFAPGFTFAAGVRNLLARNYEDPVDLTWDRIRANGRTWYVRLSWRLDE